MGLTVSDGVRSHIQGVVQAHDALDLEALQIACEFSWLDTSNARFPELVGDLRVSPMAGVSEEHLARLVFIIPEFYVDGHEPFRVDSFYYQRVNNSRISVTSSRTNRNVLSFRLIDGTWKAGIFAYPKVDSLWVRESAESQIRDAVAQRISKTVAAFLLKCLPDDRLLTQEEVADANSFLMAETLENAVT